MLKNMLQDSMRLFSGNFIGIVSIVVPVIISAELFEVIYSNYFIGEESTILDHFLPILVNFLVYPLYIIPVIFYIASIINGEIIKITDAWKLGLRYWASYIILAIIVSLIIASGLILLVVPGIIFAVRYAFSEFYLLLEKKDPLEAMRFSWETTRLYFWELLGGFLIISFILYVPFSLIILIYELQELEMELVETALNLVYSVFGVIYTIFVFRVYSIAIEKG